MINNSPQNIRGDLDVVIERAKPEDAEEMVQVHARSWTETYPNAEMGITEKIVHNWIYGPNNEKLPDRINRYRASIKNQDESHATFVARQGNKIIGLSLPYIEKTSRHRLGALYVLKEAWGRGIGGELIKKALEWHGANDVYLMVASYNLRAIKFYEKYGFCKTGLTKEKSLSEKHEDIKMPEIEMVRKYSS